MWLGSGCDCGCGVGQAATALIRPLAWEPPYAASAVLKRPKKKKKKKKNRKTWEFPKEKTNNSFFF